MIKAILTIGLAILPTVVSGQECKELADFFSNDPESMSLTQLAKLKTCIEEDVDKKLEVPLPVGQPGPPPQPLPAPSANTLPGPPPLGPPPEWPK